MITFIIFMLIYTLFYLVWINLIWPTFQSEIVAEALAVVQYERIPNPMPLIKLYNY